MIKPVSYAGSLINTYEIEGVPHASMSDILSLVVKGSWNDYVQVLNSSDDLVYDLDAKYIEYNWLVPVRNVSKWLYTFSLRNMKGDLYDRFRLFRRDVENVIRVAWALPVEDLVCRDYESIYQGEGLYTIYDIANIFLSFGMTDDEISGASEEGEMFGPLHYLEFIASSTGCGSRGSLLCDQIQYIEELPNGDSVFRHINEVLMSNLVPPTEYLDDYLDDLNTFISLEATRFVGEL